MSGRDYISDVAESVPFDNTSTAFVSDNVQDAIIEAYNIASNASRGPTVVAYDGVANVGRYLEFYSNNPSSTNPFVISEPAQLIALSISASVNSTGTVTIYKNGVGVQTLSLAASRTNRIKGLTHLFTDLDEISASITSGSISRPTVFLFIRTLP